MFFHLGLLGFMHLDGIYEATGSISMGSFLYGGFFVSLHSLLHFQPIHMKITGLATSVNI